MAAEEKKKPSPAKKEKKPAPVKTKEPKQPAILVRMDKAFRANLNSEAEKVGISLNELAILKLKQPLAPNVLADWLKNQKK